MDSLTRQKLKHYRPYPKQKLFHEAGGLGKTFRLFFAGNQIGKSECGTAELAMHLLGRYPSWWEGKRFSHPILAWAGSNTNITTKDILEVKLFGEKSEPGTGFIPEDCIGDKTSHHNIRDAHERVLIRHESGGWSTIVFKSYSQGDLKWQGVGVDVILLDEEPDSMIWGEAIARVSRTDGIIMMTFTPRFGMSRVVREFYPKCDNDEKFYVRMELDEAMHADGTSHLTDEQRDKIRKRYPKYQRDARVRGLPQLGSGSVYPIDAEERIMEDPIKPGKHWRHIIGLDLGGAESATAWVWIAIDPDTGVVHLLHTYKVVNPILAVHAASIIRNARNVPVAWPHDAKIHGTGGKTKKYEYQQMGVRMLRDPARFTDMEGGGNNVEDGISKIYNMMESGHFKAGRHLTDFWDEFRMYHRYEGKIVKENDHILDALRYAFMSLNFARRIGIAMSLPSRGSHTYDPLDPLRRHGGISKKYPSREPHEWYDEDDFNITRLN